MINDKRSRVFGACWHDYDYVYLPIMIFGVPLNQSVAREYFRGISKSSGMPRNVYEEGKAGSVMYTLFIYSFLHIPRHERTANIKGMRVNNHGGERREKEV